MGISDTGIPRIWPAHAGKPLRAVTLPPHNGPLFAEKLEAVVGLYLGPPEHAIVPGVDENCQAQARDRTEPGLPLNRGRAKTMTQDYKRYGATTLFAALDAATGQVIRLCQRRHRHQRWHQRWHKFSCPIDEAAPRDHQIHWIANNHAAHEQAQVLRWLKRLPRFPVHFTPSSASWLSMLERFFRDLTKHRRKRGAFPSDHHNAETKAFIGTARAEDILAKLMRAQNKLNQCQTVRGRPLVLSA